VHDLHTLVLNASSFHLDCKPKANSWRPNSSFTTLYAPSVNSSLRLNPESDLVLFKYSDRLVVINTWAEATVQPWWTPKISSQVPNPESTWPQCLTEGVIDLGLLILNNSFGPRSSVFTKVWRSELCGSEPSNGSVSRTVSDLTKEQEGRDQKGKDVTNDCQGKALREAVVKEMSSGECSSREKKDTNRNLARATTKSKSRMQTVSNGHVSQGERNWGVWRVSQCRRLVKWVG